MKKIIALLLAVMMVCALCDCGGSKNEPAPAEAPAAPAAPAAAPAAPAAEAPAAPAEGEPSGEPSGPMAMEGDFEITVNGQKQTIHLSELADGGDQATKGIQVTLADGSVITGTIDKGQYSADDAANQAIFEAVQAAWEAEHPQPASGEPSEEPAA